MRSVRRNEMTNESLVDYLKETGAIRTRGVEDAFRVVDRALFVPEGEQALAYEDTSLPIGQGQTISQPTVVARCLEWLEVRPGDRVLDVGSGSGYTTALLAQLAGGSGEVAGLEIVPELVTFGRENLAKRAPKNARIEQAGEELGRPGGAFDRILVSAAAREIPEALKRQLKDGGRMVISVGSAICIISRAGDAFSETCHEGYIFVPLVT